MTEYIYLHQPVFILARWHVEGSEHGDRCIVETRFGEDIEVWFDELQEKPAKPTENEDVVDPLFHYIGNPLKRKKIKRY